MLKYNNHYVVDLKIGLKYAIGKLNDGKSAMNALQTSLIIIFLKILSI